MAFSFFFLCRRDIFSRILSITASIFGGSLFVFFLSGCALNQKSLFELKKPTQSQVFFENTLTYTQELNPYTYKNFFNGAGVGIGDFNNDGLADLFFVGNLVSNRLYLNKGGFEFEDITVSAGLWLEGVWNTGVSLLDINGDGFLDIYVTKSGPPGGGDKRRNALYINNKDLTFSEKAKEYGLDNLGLSVHAAFFDYDKDGDLDCYLLNNSIRSVGQYDLIKDQRSIPDPNGGNKFFLNDKGYFRDITNKAGIYSSEIGFGLGVTIGDINQDGWPDIYVSNDYFERDYLYINQKNGRFLEQLEPAISELSLGSMGADLADINNDALPDIFVTEMLPERYDRLKSKTLFESWNKYQLAIQQGYHQQFGRNVLQLNNGNMTFSEIARFSGVEATDWSWGALIFDMDNDGLKDLFVANGIYKDLLDHDYMRFMSDRPAVQKILKSKKNAMKTLIDLMPSEAIPNAVFQNQGHLKFAQKRKAWGFETPSFSNGSAYGDLDNDGDLDLVVNNVNMPAFIYENKSNDLYPENHYLHLKLIGQGQNTQAIGAKIKAFVGDDIIYQELNPMRGFQSSVDSQLVLGLGNTRQIDRLEIEWPDDRITVLHSVDVNQKLTLYQKQAKLIASLKQDVDFAATLLTKSIQEPIIFKHQENTHVDFNSDRLLLQMQSTQGPCLCKGDVNQDGLEDVYVGGAFGQAGRLFIQYKNAFVHSPQVFDQHAEYEDVDCEFFDANGDGYLDLMVASGGSEFRAKSKNYEDRLYIGSKKTIFQQSKQFVFSKNATPTAKILPFDFDSDGDLDLFVASAMIPGFYGLSPDSFLLENEGEGTFKDVSYRNASMFKQLGMIRDAVWIDQTEKQILIVAGHWMPIKAFEFVNKKAIDVSKSWGFENTNAWVNVLEAVDVNGDGLKDLIVGNQGLNNRFKATEQKPLEMWIDDFDQNGSIETLIAMQYEEDYYPLHQFNVLTKQLPVLRKKYLKSEHYKQIAFKELLAEFPRSQPIKLETKDFETALWLNTGESFKKKSLPTYSQFSPVYSILAKDIDGDQAIDIILGGNIKEVQPEFGMHQASYGVVLKGNNQGEFSYIPPNESGFSIQGDIRDIINIKWANKKMILLAKNNQELESYEY